MTGRIEAVLFDWDLTLGRLIGDVSYEERLVAQFARRNYVYDLQAIRIAISKRERGINDGSIVGKVEPQTEEEFIAYFQQLLSLLGHGHISRGEAKEVRAAYAELPFILYDDTLPTLESLAQGGIRIGIITNHSSRIMETIWKKVGRYVPEEAITISQVVGCSKPDGEIFKIGAQSVEAEPQACMYVGDDLEVDVIPALKEGGYAKALWLNRTGNPDPPSLPPGAVEISRLTDVIRELC